MIRSRFDSLNGWVPASSIIWKPNRIPLLYSPVALWNFDGSIQDSSNNNHHWSVFSGSEKYIDLWPGTTALSLQVGDSLICSDSQLILSSALTIILAGVTEVQLMNTERLLNNYWIACGSDGAGEDHNIQYGFGTSLQSNSKQATYWCEYGPSSTHEYVAQGPSRLGDFVVRAVTRRNDGLINIYENGTLRKTFISSMPTGGSLNSTFFGRDAQTGRTSESPSYWTGAALYSSELTAAQIKLISDTVLEGR